MTGDVLGEARARRLAAERLTDAQRADILAARDKALADAERLADEAREACGGQALILATRAQVALARARAEQARLDAA